MKTTNLLNSIRLFVLFSGLFLFCSCSKNETTYAGLVRFSGDVAVDGCGWVIDVENGTFHPNNLSAEFQQDSLAVELSYKGTNEKYNCGLGNSLKIIEISSIEKQ
jgi:hypothetical protein